MHESCGRCLGEEIFASYQGQKDSQKEQAKQEKEKIQFDIVGNDETQERDGSSSGTRILAQILGWGELYQGRQDMIDGWMGGSYNTKLFGNPQLFCCSMRKRIFQKGCDWRAIFYIHSCE